MLQLLLFLGLREPPRCRRSTSNTQLTLGRIRCRSTLDLDLESTKRHLITWGGGFRRCRLFSSSSSRFLILGLAVRLPFGLLFRVTLLIKPIKTLASEAGASDFRFTRLDLLKES